MIQVRLPPSIFCSLMLGPEMKLEL